MEKMRADGAPEVALQTFAHYYDRLAAGETGTIAEDEIEPVGDLPSAADLPDPDAAGYDALERAVVIRLNGGLGTSMGMTGPKSLLEAKDGLTFLDIIVRQVLALRARFAARLPLVLMNSFRTRDETLAALERHPELHSDVPPDFLQGRVPKIRADDLEPVSWPDDPSLEWTPPGHGDVYTSLVTSGMLDRLLEHGYEYALIANSDNLGAVMEPRILAWFAREDLPFAMEVLRRSESDRKGGHIARRKGGGLVLRESAQVRDEDQDAFQDIERHRYFNTNNLWINLRKLKDVLAERGNVLGLPMIVNRKTVNPSDSSSPEVFQLETAMGAAIDAFDGAAALLVGRERFAPGEDDQRPARAALRRLRPRRGRARGAGAAAKRRAALRGSRLGQLQAAARLRPALPRGRAVPRGLRPPGRPRRRGLRQGRRHPRHGDDRASGRRSPADRGRRRAVRLAG